MIEKTTGMRASLPLTLISINQKPNADLPPSFSHWAFDADLKPLLTFFGIQRLLQNSFLIGTDDIPAAQHPHQFFGILR